MRFLEVVFVMVTVTVSDQVRDVPSAPRVGQGAVTGIVLDEQRQPVRRATVRLEEGTALRTAVTDADGRFQFGQLPFGRYSLSASKPAYLTGHYGARRPGGPGTSIVLTPAQPVMDSVLSMPRGGVIAGRVFGPEGDGAPDVPVRLLRSRLTAGGHMFAPVPARPGAGTATTDDRGDYRFFGLDPGVYVVAAAPRLEGSEIRVMTAFEGVYVVAAVPRLEGSDIRLMTTADLEGARGDARRGPTAPLTRARTVTLAPVYYPGTIAEAMATPITIGFGEERSGIDIRVELVGTFRVEGSVSRADGQPAGGLSVGIIRDGVTGSWLGAGAPRPTATTSFDGSFVLTNVVPGTYQLFASTFGVLRVTNGGSSSTVSVQSSGAAGSLRQDALMSAVVPLTVTGDLSGVSLIVHPGISLSGRVVPATGGSAIDPTRLTVSLVPANDAPQVTRVLPPAHPSTTGEFDVAHIAAGRYRVVVDTASASTGARWSVSSVVVNGRETVDTGVVVTPDDAALNAVVTLTDRLGELAGQFQDSSGQPASDYTIVMFSTDRSRWTWESRYIKVTRPSSDGRYVFQDLEPGDYLLSAVTDLEPDEWFDPALLERLAPASIRLAIAAHERKVQDIRMQSTQGRSP